MIADALRALQSGDVPGARVLLDCGDSDDGPESLLALHLAALLAFAADERDAGRARLERAAALERESGLLPIARHSEHALALLLNDDASLAKTKSYYRETWDNVRKYSGAEAQALIAKSLAELCLAGGRLPEGARLLTRAAELIAADEPCAASLATWADLVAID